jgi:hypothetical protein
MRGCFAISTEDINIIIWSNPKILRLATGFGVCYFSGNGFRNSSGVRDRRARDDEVQDERTPTI